MFICTDKKLLRELTDGENIKSLKDCIIIKLQIIYSKSHSAIYSDFFLLLGGISGYYNHTFHGLIFFFKSFYMAYGILVPHPGSWQWEPQVLTTGLPGDFPWTNF